MTRFTWRKIDYLDSSVITSTLFTSTRYPKEITYFKHQLLFRVTGWREKGWRDNRWMKIIFFASSKSRLLLDVLVWCQNHVNADIKEDESNLTLNFSFFRVKNIMSNCLFCLYILEFFRNVYIFKLTISKMRLKSEFSNIVSCVKYDRIQTDSLIHTNKPLVFCYFFY